MILLRIYTLNSLRPGGLHYYSDSFAETGLLTIGTFNLWKYQAKSAYYNSFFYLTILLINALTNTRKLLIYPVLEIFRGLKLSRYMPKRIFLLSLFLIPFIVFIVFIGFQPLNLNLLFKMDVCQLFIFIHMTCFRRSLGGMVG